MDESFVEFFDVINTCRAHAPTRAPKNRRSVSQEEKLVKEVRFSNVRAFLEEHGWELSGFRRTFRVFLRYGKSAPGSPIVVEVHNKMVDADHYREVRRIVHEIESKEDDGS